jgi:hypothetical protein
VGEGLGGGLSKVGARVSAFGKLNAGLDGGVEESYAEPEQVTDESREAPALLFLYLESVSS